MTRPTWDQRISRARELGEVYPSAAEVLAFYAAVASFQRDLYNYLRAARGKAQLSGPSFRDRLESVLVVPRFPVFLSLIRQVAPEALAAVAARIAAGGRWDKLLRAPTMWPVSLDRLRRSEPRTTQVGETVLPPMSLGASVSGGPPLSHPAKPALSASARESEAVEQSEAEAFLVRAFLQPHAEFVVEQVPPARPTSPSATCPACGSEPVVAVLREESLGARRSLVCSLCAYEWEFPRAICPGCGEDRPEHLSVFTAAQFEHVRVDACDTCKTYVKTIDLTKNGLAIPVVDEIATLPLTLWAQENGYSKLQPNLIAA